MEKSKTKYPKLAIFKLILDYEFIFTLIINIKLSSNHSDINIVRLIKFSIFENGVNLFLFRMVISER
jgi:hypothetical protein